MLFTNNKKTSTFTFLSLLILSGLQYSFTIEDWFQFRSIEGRFRVMTKGGFERKVATFETDIGEVQSCVYAYTPKDQQNSENLVYMISYNDYPEGTIHSDSTAVLEDFYKATIEESVSSVNGVKIYENDVKLQGFVGKQWRISYANNKATIKTRAFLVKNRYYAIQTVSLSEKSANTATQRFLDSFQLLGQD